MCCLNISLDIKLFALLTVGLKSKEISALPNDTCVPFSIISTGAISEYLSQELVLHHKIHLTSLYTLGKCTCSREFHFDGCRTGYDKLNYLEMEHSYILFQTSIVEFLEQQRKRSILNIPDIDEMQQGRQWELCHCKEMNTLFLQKRRKKVTMADSKYFIIIQ